jgi:hypothetical protein
MFRKLKMGFLVMWILFKRGIFISKINDIDRQEIRQLVAELQRILGTEPPHIIKEKSTQIKAAIESYAG